MTTTGSPAAPSSGTATRSPDALPWPPVVALSLGYFVVMLDVAVVTVAVPDIRTSLGAGSAALQWIVDGYSTVFAGLLLLGGGLGDRLGHRATFLTGLALFTAASAACGLAGSPGALVAARLAQGAGAALLLPASLALLTATCPGRAARARALGVWGGVAGVAFASGPLVGGLLVSGLGWRSVFWLNLPVAALTAVLTVRHIPGRRGRPGARMDVRGGLLGVVGLTALAGALNEAGTASWTSPLVIAGFVLAGAALTAFVLAEARLEAGSALLPPSLFRSAGFAATAAIGVLLNFGYFGMLFLATLYFQVERGYDALGAGLALLPSVCGAVLGAPISGRLTARHGPYRPMAAALLLGAVGFPGWLAAGPETPYPVLLFALVATGLATPLTVPAATAAIIESAPPGGVGIASAVFNVARQVGNAVGVALFGTLAARTGGLVTGMHLSAVMSATAFLLGSLLATAAGLRARARRRAVA